MYQNINWTKEERHEILLNPEAYPELHRIEVAKNKLKLGVTR